MKYEQAAQRAVNANNNLSTEAVVTILGAAFDCDQKRSSLARELHEMSERFQRLAKTVEAGERIDVPINSITDLSEASAVYHHHARFLRLLIKSHLSAEIVLAFEKDLGK